MNIFEISIWVAMIILSGCLLLGMIRFFKGPTVPDRITAFDLLAANVIGLIAIYAVITKDIAFMDVAIILSLIAFLSSMFFAYYLVKKKNN
jgi:multicomponent Na+:H+ antiporter subunit F